LPRPRRNRITRQLSPLLALLIAGVVAGDEPLAPLLDRSAIPDRRDPPPRRPLQGTERAAFDLGLLVFNTPWVAADTPSSARRDGLGPLFISSSCDACHNNGARGRPPDERGGLSNSFVMQLAGAEELYGAVLNTSALPDHSREGLVQVEWTQRAGQYADGMPWSLREPHYSLTHLLYGAPPGDAVLRPRIAPAIFGAGLIEAVPPSALRGIRGRQRRAVRGVIPAGHFGWQGEAKDIEDQTARAFAREMGLTSRPRPQDDCSLTQIACRASPQGGSPEVSDEFMHAVLTLQRELPVPTRAVLAPQNEDAGRKLFIGIGCADCHVERLPTTANGAPASIDAYTDLLLHDLGDGIADRRVDGRIVKSRWRTAPLWGLAHARRFDAIALLHDGRAASVEQAILWHGGQAEPARAAFTHLHAVERWQLLDWVESL
jgi:CxxC motif-containing protein (DUF1111 family)